MGGFHVTEITVGVGEETSEIWGATEGASWKTYKIWIIMTRYRTCRPPPPFPDFFFTWETLSSVVELGEIGDYDKQEIPSSGRVVTQSSKMLC